MSGRPFRRALAATAVVACVTFSGLTATGASAGPPGRPGHGPHDRTSRVEAARVDRVATPDPGWEDCSQEAGTTAQCGTVDLPLDYDRPRGATTRVALLRIPATDPDARIGTLFLNPGGPGGSGVLMALQAPQFLPEDVRARFDVVGFDPRGVGLSAGVRCFPDAAAQGAAIAPMVSARFPLGDEQTAGFLDAARALGRACSTTGTPLSASMSTAEVARDLDVLRRAVGDEKLSYLGFSYGSYLGQVYANMFPDRFRALVVDGVVDPVAWAGTPRTARTPVFDRIGSAEASGRALDGVLDRCAEAGPDVCRTAALGAPRDVWQQLGDGARTTPVPLEVPGVGVLPLSWQDVVSLVLAELYSPVGAERVDVLVSALRVLQEPATPQDAEARAQASRDVLALYEDTTGEAAEQQARAAALAERFGLDPTYANDLEALDGVVCTDALAPRRVEDTVAAAAASEALAPGFGPAWTWLSAPCATSTWTARDEDAWRGPFDARTAVPVLVVGNLWDPATRYEGAQAAAAQLPNSRLLVSDSWGHAAYGTSACASDAVDHYLLTGEVPAEGTTCVGDAQPFADRSARTARAPRALPPVVPLLVPAVPETLRD